LGYARSQAFAQLLARIKNDNVISQRI